MGPRAHQPQGNSLTSEQSEDQFSEQRPLAPAPWLVLAGVVFMVVGACIAIDRLVANDWVAVFAFFAVLLSAAGALNHTGRQRASEHPHPLYRPDRLPADRAAARLRIITAIVVLAGLLVYVSATATPGSDYGSPTPYFLAAAFVYLVVPQLSSRWLVHRYNRNHKV